MSEKAVGGTNDGDAPRRATEGDDSERALEAGLLPRLWGNGDDGTVDVTVYVVTGRHGLLRVPERFCRECHLFARRADAAAERTDADVTVRVRSWWTHFPLALVRGGYHPPVLVVDGSMLCQGHDVPTTDEVVAAIEAARDP